MASTRASNNTFPDGRDRTTPTSDGAITVSQTHATLHFGGLGKGFELNADIPGGSGGTVPFAPRRQAAAILQINDDGDDKLRIQNDDGDYEDVDGEDLGFDELENYGFEDFDSVVVDEYSMGVNEAVRDHSTEDFQYEYMSSFMVEQQAQPAESYTIFGDQREGRGEHFTGEGFDPQFMSTFGESNDTLKVTESRENDHENLSEGNDLVQNFAMLGVDREDGNKQKYFDDHDFLLKMLATAEEIPGTEPFGKGARFTKSQKDHMAMVYWGVRKPPMWFTKELEKKWRRTIVPESCLHHIENLRRAEINRTVYPQVPRLPHMTDKEFKAANLPGETAARMSVWQKLRVEYVGNLPISPELFAKASLPDRQKSGLVTGTLALRPARN